MNEQTKAQRLADEFDNGEPIAHTNQWKEEAADEPRRLDALNAELVEALRFLLMDTEHKDHDCESDEQWCPVKRAKAALAKAKEQT